MRVRENRPETPSTRRLRLALEGEPFEFAAGQAAGLRARADVEYTPYSIASSPAEARRARAIEFLIKVDGSNRFGAQVTDLSEGTLVGVDGPYGRFTLPPDPLPGHLLFIAGGTGIAPLRGMIHDVLARRPDARPTLLYSSRAPDEFAYLDEFRALERSGALRLSLTLTGDYEDSWSHARGRASAAHLESLVRPESVCFLCGPPSMVSDLPGLLTSLGVRQGRIRTEEW